MASCTFCDNEATTTLLVRKSGKTINANVGRRRIKMEKTVPVCDECERDVERSKPPVAKKPIPGQTTIDEFLT